MQEKFLFSTSSCSLDTQNCFTKCSDLHSSPPWEYLFSPWLFSLTSRFCQFNSYKIVSRCCFSVLVFSIKLSIFSWTFVFLFCEVLLLSYMTAGKTIALTIQTFVSKVMYQVFNLLSRLPIAFLPRSKCLLISWLQSPSAVILEPNSLSLFPLFPYLYAIKWVDQMPWS